MRAAAQWVIVGFAQIYLAALLPTGPDALFPPAFKTILAAGASLLTMFALLECFFWDEPMPRTVTLRIRINRASSGGFWGVWCSAGDAPPLETVLPGTERMLTATFPVGETCKLRVADQTLAGGVVSVYNKVFLTGYSAPHCEVTDPLVLEVVEA